MKGSRKKLPTEIDLAPNQRIDALPLYLLKGAEGWDSLNQMDCVHIDHTEYEPDFAYITNMTEEIITLDIKPTELTPELKHATLDIDPKKPPHAIYKSSLDKPKRLRSLEQEKKLILTPIRYIGPPIRTKGAVGSFLGEDVYICYECGGPIIFRYHPPIPIHI
jgi:hypothetical protein